MRLQEYIVLPYDEQKISDPLLQDYMKQLVISLQCRWADIANVVNFNNKSLTCVNVLDPPFSASPGGVDCTSAIQNAINVAASNGHHFVYIPTGLYYCTGTITRHEGVMIIGAAPGATKQNYGTWIIHQSNSDLFVCDGNGRSAAGVGGGFKDISILKDSGYTGGVGIKYIATNDTHRPGEEFIENILVYGTGGGLWDHAIEIDGTACSTPGSIGVRTIVMHKVRISDCQEDNEFLLINQGTHISATHFSVSVGGSTGIPGITIKGESTNIQFVNATINGDVLIEDTSDHINIEGRIASLTQNTTTAIGSFTGSITSGGKLVNKSYSFKINSSSAPKFQAKMASSVGNVTGDNTDYTIIFETEKFDINSDYDHTTGVFTCTCAGYYHFHTQVLLNGVAAAHTTGEPYLLHKNSVGGELNGTDKILAVYNGSSGGYFSYDLYGFFRLSYGDTVESVANVSGSTKTISVSGAAGTEYTFFDGHLT